MGIRDSLCQTWYGCNYVALERGDLEVNETASGLRREGVFDARHLELVNASMLL